MGLHLPSNVHLQSSIPTATAPPQTRRSLMARSPEADQAAVLGSQEMPLNGSLGTFLVATGFVLFFVLLSAVALWKLHARRRRACLAEAVLGAGGVAVSPAQHRVVQRFRIVRLGNAGDDRDVEKGELGESVKKLKVPKIAVIPSSPQVKRTSAPLSPDGAMLRPPPPERSPLRPRPSSVLLPSQVLEADRNRTITKVDWLNGDRTKEMKSHIPAHAEKHRGAKKQGGKENAMPQHGDAAVVKNRTRSKGLGVHWA